MRGVATRHQFSTVAYPEDFHGGFHAVAYGSHLYLVYAVCDVTFWRHIHGSKQHFGEVCWHNMHILLHPLSLFLCHCTEYKLSALQVRVSEENKINTTTQQLITAKISGCAWKPGSKTHSSLRQSNSQLQNEAALMSCRIRAVEHRKCAAGHAGAHPGLQCRILRNYTRIENAHKVHKNFQFFVMYRRKSSKLLVFLFPAATLSNSWKLLC